MLHGPPIYPGQKPPIYSNALWALRYKIAMGEVMPKNKLAGCVASPSTFPSFSAFLPLLFIPYFPCQEHSGTF